MLNKDIILSYLILYEMPTHVRPYIYKTVWDGMTSLV